MDFYRAWNSTAKMYTKSCLNNGFMYTANSNSISLHAFRVNIHNHLKLLEGDKCWIFTALLLQNKYERVSAAFVKDLVLAVSTSVGFNKWGFPHQ